MSPAARRPTDAERVELMLSVLPWLAATGGAPLAEVAAHFDADADALRHDLMRVFYDVEPELGADTMVEVDIDDTDDAFVSVRLPGSFEEPPRLDHSEALLLLAAGSALLGERGTDVALEPAVRKLRDALGEGAQTALEVDLGGGDPAVRDMLRAAVRDHQQVRLDYFSWGSDEVRARTVDPWALHSVRGHWYLTGYCHDRGAVRHFRLDRVLAARAVGDAGAFEAPDAVPTPDADFTRGGRRVMLRIPADSAWIIESFPVESYEDEGDTIEIVLGVHHDAWLDRILLRLPPESVATDADTGEDLTHRRDAAARRVLERHGANGDGAPRR